MKTQEKKVSKKDLMNIPCEFAQWIDDNMFTNTYQDEDNDGMTWTNYNNDDMHLSREDVKRYTIQEIYSYFLIDTKRV